jgi:hypothetical protein
MINDINDQISNVEIEEIRKKYSELFKIHSKE